MIHDVIPSKYSLVLTICVRMLGAALTSQMTVAFDWRYHPHCRRVGASEELLLLKMLLLILMLKLGKICGGWRLIMAKLHQVL